MPHRVRWLLTACACGVLGASLPAQIPALPLSRFIAASSFAVPGRVDSGVPMLWTRIDGQQTLVAFASWGGIPVRMAGADLEHLQPAGDPVITPHPGDGIWFESVIADQNDTTWYAYYHHEAPALACGRPESIPRIGAAKSNPRGHVTIWQDGVWLSPLRRAGTSADGQDGLEYPAGTPLVRTTSPWHDRIQAANAFWGPSIHWIHHFNATSCSSTGRGTRHSTTRGFTSRSQRRSMIREWSAPRKILNGGDWYPQVAGLEAGWGTDKQMGRIARFFLTGRSTRYIEFTGR